MSRGQPFERLLFSRLEKYGLEHDLHDTDRCIQHLKTSFHEYRRQKSGPLRTQVSRVIGELLKRKAEDEEEEQSEEISDTAAEQVSWCKQNKHLSDTACCSCRRQS